MRIEINSFSKLLSQKLISKSFFSCQAVGQMKLLINELDDFICSTEKNLKTKEEINELYEVANIFLIHAMSVIQGEEIKIVKRDDLNKSNFSINDKLLSLNISKNDLYNFKQIYNYSKNIGLNVFSDDVVKGNEKTRILMRNFYGDRL